MVGDQAMTAVAIGVGFRKGCPADVIEALVRQALDKAAASISLGLFTLIDKQSELGLSEAADRLGLRITYLSREALRERAGDTATSSPNAEKQFGVPSVAEAAALAGAGPASVLIVPRIAQNGATCAIAGAAP
jgi:cobalt-precorrin 5A hydrolase